MLGIVEPLRCSRDPGLYPNGGLPPEKFMRKAGDPRMIFDAKMILYSSKWNQENRVKAAISKR
jgi:hypothetical protein